MKMQQIIQQSFLNSQKESFIFDFMPFEGLIIFSSHNCSQ